VGNGSQREYVLLRFSTQAGALRPSLACRASLLPEQSNQSGIVSRVCACYRFGSYACYVIWALNQPAQGPCQVV
jgi:hypothetical protein